jgi:hypothetical protein
MRRERNFTGSVTKFSISDSCTIRLYSETTSEINQYCDNRVEDLLPSCLALLLTAGRSYLRPCAAQAYTNSTKW